MSDVAVELAYRYLKPSTVSLDGMALATSSIEEPALYFDGFLERPDQAAVALLCVARVARTRFYEPPGMVAAKIRAADPVVTVEPTGLRFESFSVCCGVHSRFDALEETLDMTSRRMGTVNVDFNPPMREALARITAAAPLHMKVGFDSVEVETFDGKVTEEQVSLPERWFRGFAEVQVAGARMEPIAELRAVEAMRFIRGLPRGNAGRSTFWLQGSGRSLRLASRPSHGSAPVAAPERLRVLEPVARFLTGLTVYGTPGEEAPTSWVASLRGARLSVTLSPHLSRGFSGEGGLLHDLVDESLGIEAELLDAALVDRWRFTSNELLDTGMTLERARRALSWLGAHGRVGYDPIDGAYFRRDCALSSRGPHKRPAATSRREAAQERGSSDLAHRHRRARKQHGPPVLRPCRPRDI